MSDHRAGFPEGFDAPPGFAAVPGGADGSPFGFGPFDEPPRPSRRRPRREETVTYRVRVEIEETEPPVWRELELDSDLFLNEVHQILQAAFAWEDYHLHGFASGGTYYSREAELYLCPFESREGRPGVPEEQVRLDEVLAEPGDRLFYLYDFGDDWEHLLTLQDVVPRQEDASRAVCTAGHRSAPPEDCGGPFGYELLSAATDTGHPEHAEALAEYRRVFGMDPDPDRAPVPFDPGAVNSALAAVAGPVPDDLPGPVADLLASVRDPRLRGRLLTLASEATAPEEEPSTATVRAAVGPYTWLLDHVGDDGVKLTGAGYLPPASVREAADALNLTGRWIGAANREVQTLPVLNLRESAQKMGLLRKYKGRLLPTKAGKAVREDPLALWEHLAERMPPAPKAEDERLGCLVAVLAAAAGSRDVPGEVAAVLTGLGWRVGDGLPVDSGAAWDAMYEAWAVLDTMGGWSRGSFSRGDAPTARGRAFARAALRSTN
ncbi:plasmid pRiA4b ORF-3 family protein [Nocardiopsis exhalans]|uniref:Plasmid pRiA4b ORF-3 family protein n=1 Tax=Nocardiopsis exhalans TaxID=163604 RepID=A0ABY5DGX1_9ACTN|nr:plasmid pRiA4b ORF-3 family protein [Nocardiopsis exhalans]USY22743.1 plasmid pRiA4b ORF-3 family protein [Nocardiopsis exhalans]